MTNSSIRGVRLVITIATLALSGSLALAQQPASGASVAAGTIEGGVTDTNLVPLANATVSIVGANLQVVTGTSGRFRVEKMPAGTYSVLVRRIGFEPAFTNVQVPRADTIRMSILLRPASTALDTVRITGRHIAWKTDEFLARRKLGEGEFITQEEIDKRNTPWVGSLLSTLLGVNVVPAGRMTEIAVNRRAGCPFEMMVDGMPTDPDLNMLPSPREIGGIEVYLGPATIPLQFKRSSSPSCGIIMIWTREQ